MPYDPSPDGGGFTASSVGGGLGTLNFNLVGGGISDFGAAFGSDLKAKGNKIEAENYREAARFAEFEAHVQHAVTEVQTAQVQRAAEQGLGLSEASIAGAGFGKGGSASDILRSSAQQGALQAAMARQTGQIQEIGFNEQAKSYQKMAEAADLAAKAQQGSGIASAVSGVAKIGAAVAFL